jgi:hypothetical protein
MDDGVIASLLPKKQPEGETIQTRRRCETVGERAAASTKQQKEKFLSLSS